MPINKENLIARIESMFWLAEDWDGFGTPPISRKAHDISLQLINHIEIEITVQAFVGVEVEGSVYFEMNRDRQRRFEITVNPDGRIDYVEFDPTTARILNEGAIALTSENINQVLA